MLTAIEGPLGAGKTLGAVYLAHKYSAKAAGAPIWTNIDLNEAYFRQHKQLNPKFKVNRLRTADDLIEMTRTGGGILLWDEIHKMMDARLSMKQKNIFLSQLMMYFRKIGIVPIFTTQFSRQVDMRLRAIIELMVEARKVPKGAGQFLFTYAIWDYQAGRRVSRIELQQEQAAFFFGAYDTHELVHSFGFPDSEKKFDEFLVRLEAAHNEYRYGKQPEANPAPVPAETTAEHSPSSTNTGRKQAPRSTAGGKGKGSSGATRTRIAASQ